jgi:hypothetical protein
MSSNSSHRLDFIKMTDIRFSYCITLKSVGARPKSHIVHTYEHSASLNHIITAYIFTALLEALAHTVVSNTLSKSTYHTTLSRTKSITANTIYRPFMKHCAAGLHGHKYISGIKVDISPKIEWATTTNGETVGLNILIPMTINSLSRWRSRCWSCDLWVVEMHDY